MPNFIVRFLVLILLIGSGLEAKSQRMGIFDSYNFNRSVINPAQVGSEGSNHFGVYSRLFYSGVFSNSPYTLSAFADFSLLENIGVGASIYYDRVGPMTERLMHADFSYHRELSSVWTISAGVRLQGMDLNIALPELEIDDPRDPAFSEDFCNYNFFAGTGILLFSDKFYIGMSAPLIPLNQNENNFMLSETPTQFFLHSGANFNLHQDWVLTPSTVIYYNQDSRYELDLNILIRYKGFLNFGPKLNLGSNETSGTLDNIGFIVDVGILEKFQIGYILAHPYRTKTFNSHMLSLRYNW